MRQPAVSLSLAALLALAGSPALAQISPLQQPPVPQAKPPAPPPPKPAAEAPPSDGPAYDV